MLPRMYRREFLLAGSAGITASLLPAARTTAPVQPRGEPFKLKYAPHFGMFEHHAPDWLDQLQFAADEGFRAWEDNGMAGRSVEDQQRLAEKMQKCSIEMGVFVAHGDFGKPTFASGDRGMADAVLEQMRKACEVARRVRAKWCTVVPGTVDHRQEPGYQTANVVELLKRCAEITAKAELTMVLEPLNFRDHPDLFLTKVAQGYQICRAVGSPFCKVLDDLYHQQVTEGNLIPNIDQAWSEIAYFQVGDNPGRCEPWSGEVNFKNVFAHIHKKGFTGIVGMEHGNSQGGKDGERKVIDAYRLADAF
jgi:hydroxypyruvate isomerase